jgi:Putative F0F1-ATPase subunit Ca2+/Mg2+ transporter
MAEPSRTTRGEPRGVPSRLAAAGRWVGERDRGRGWEDYLAEFLAAILTWAGIGWLLDRWLGTDPWLLIGGAILGNSLGIYLLWIRSKAEHEKASGKPHGDGK